MLSNQNSNVLIRTTPVQKIHEELKRPEHSNFFNPTQNTSMGVGEFEDDDDGWITPDNIDEYTKSFTGVQIGEEKQQIEVACLTTDFAMQNVLLQMNMNLLSIDGLSIKRVQKWIKRCYGCYRVCKETDKLFCPSCGGDTLEKVSYTVDSEGNTYYNLPRRKRNLRGTIYPIPLPKGGRKNNDLILRPDQLPRYWKNPKVNLEENEDDIILDARKKPPKSIPVVGYGKRNPNQSRRKIGKKNKSKRRGF